MNKKTTTSTSKKQDKATAEVLKVGIDVHKKKYVFVCQYEGKPRGQTVIFDIFES